MSRVPSPLHFINCLRLDFDGGVLVILGPIGVTVLLFAFLIVPAVLHLHHLHLLKLHHVLHLLLPHGLLLLGRHVGHHGVGHKGVHGHTGGHAGDIGQELLLQRTCRVLVARIARHLHAEFGFVPTKELVEVRSRLGTTGDAGKAPAVELAGETREFARLEVLGEDFIGEGLLLVDDKAVAMGKPTDNVGVGFVGKDVHQLCGKT